MQGSESQPSRRQEGSPDRATRPEDSAGVARDRPLILVVDDDEGVREALQTVLTDEGYAVELAANGREAIVALEEGVTPDLVVLDLRMPIMTGWGVWDHLQVNPTLARIPVLIFTGTGLSQGAVGPATVLPKHVGIDRFLEAVTKLLRAD